MSVDCARVADPVEVCGVCGTRCWPVPCALCRGRGRVRRDGRPHGVREPRDTSEPCEPCFGLGSYLVCPRCRLWDPVRPGPGSAEVTDPEGS